MRVDVTHSSSGKIGTGTDLSDLLRRLNSNSWATVRSGLEEAERFLERSYDSASEDLLAAVLMHATHSKWEVRLVVARIGGLNRHSMFASALGALATDEHQRVRKAAAGAIRRRRNWSSTSALEHDHQLFVRTHLEKIETAFGSQAADAVWRTSEVISNVVARELYHEALRLLTPIATSADKIALGVASDAPDLSTLKAEGLRLTDRVKRLTRTLDAMRDFTAQPRLSFASASLRSVVVESVQQVLDARPSASPTIGIDIPESLELEIDRSRLIGAVVNVLANAVEAYEGRTEPAIEVTAIDESSRVTLVISDRGSGMSEEGRRDALRLFSSGKKDGTGFGLPLAVKIVETEHDGRLLIEGRDGGGTVVKMVLPRHHTGTQ